MTYALVSNIAASSSDANAVTTASLDTTGADLIVVVVAHANSGGITVTENKSNGAPTALTEQAETTVANQIFL